MIPKKLVDFVHGPVVLHLGTRSTDLRPTYAMVFGALANGEAGTITFCIPDVEGEQPLRDLDDNGAVALTAVAASHKTYQFKGKRIETRPSGEREKAIIGIHKEKLSADFAQIGIEPAFWAGYNVEPSTAVTFEVEEIFVQTPGPGAGERIDAAEAAT